MGRNQGDYIWNTSLTEVLNDMHLGDRIFNAFQRNLQGHVSKELTFYSVAKMVNSDKYGGGHSTYLHRKLPYDLVLSILRNDYNNNRVGAAGTMD